MKNASIKYWAEDDRPREKLMSNGADALSTSELLAILLKNGSRDKSALTLAKELLATSNNSLHQLSSLSINEMIKLRIKGLGPVKAVTIAAALELGLRRHLADFKKIKITRSRDIAEYLKTRLQYKKHEAFGVMFLNQRSMINHFEILSEGGITSTVVDTRIIMKKAVEHDAIGLVLCHNHPSGDVKPSREDEVLTQRISRAAALFDIKIFDHIIVGNDGYFSFADEGML